MEPYIAFEKENGQRTVTVLAFDFESRVFMVADLKTGVIGFISSSDFTNKFRFKNLVK